MLTYLNKILIGILFLFSLSCGGNKPSPVVNKRSSKKIDTLSYVKNIDNYVLNIESQKLDSIEYDIYESSEGGSRVLFFTEDDTLKERVIFYGETGKRIIIKYLKKNNFVYIQDESMHYNAPIYENDGNIKVDAIKVESYYLTVDGSIVLWETNGKKRPSSQYMEQKKVLPVEW